MGAITCPIVGALVAGFLTTACGSWAVWGCQGLGARAPTFLLQFVETSEAHLLWQLWLELPSFNGGSAAAALARVPDSAGDYRGHGS